MTHFIIIQNCQAIRGYDSEKRALEYAKKKASKCDPAIVMIEVLDTLKGEYIYTNQNE